MKKFYILLFLFSLGILYPQNYTINWDQLINEENVKNYDVNIEYYNYKTRIFIENNHLTIQKKEYEYDNPVSPVPSKITTKKYEKNISTKNLIDLLKSFKENNFFNLKQEYGAPEGQRFYPIYIKITIKEKMNNQSISKEVIFRSNPMYSAPPKEFLNIEKAILNLIY
ncbi:MAG: hypothetical protein KatS3mg129_3257 [Leptospiraceae bacterium]|nr:MAG: hypothetical protein KatS3mg129_3257 [Leptospiraceae bacterium]